MLWAKNFFGKILSLGNKKKGAGNPARFFWGGNGTKSPYFEQKKLEFSLAKFRP
jgi:hypothetical protein